MMTNGRFGWYHPPTRTGGWFEPEADQTFLPGASVLLATDDEMRCEGVTMNDVVGQKEDLKQLRSSRLH
uniref:Uncharacterized protein n=1 Tax=Anopheles minimus TaxID=112268 RepID=A0A182VRC8_9DIPT